MQKPPQYNIRTARASDVRAILAIEHACFDSDYFSKRQFTYLITRAKGVFYVVEEQEHLLGYISCLVNARAERLRIYSIAVHPAAQGRGIARRLIEQALHYAHQAQLARLTLEVKTTNEAAIKLYENSGFVRTGILSAYYHDGSDAYTMQCPLQV